MEIVLFAKNELKMLQNRDEGNVVVFHDVLYFKPNTQKTTTIRLTSGSDLVVEEDMNVVTSNESSSVTRSRFVKWPSSGRPTGTQNLNPKYSFPGSASFSLDPDTDGSYDASSISISETKSSSSSPSSIGQVEVVSSAGATSTQEIQVRFKSSATGTEQAYLSVYAWFVPPLKVNVTANSTALITNTLDTPYDDRVKIIAGSGGNIFISDKNLELNTTYATFLTYSIGGIQVRLKDIVASDGVLFESQYSGSITYIIAHNS